MTENQRHLTQLECADGSLILTLGEPVSVSEALAAANRLQQDTLFTSTALNEPLMAILAAHPSFHAGYKNSTTKVLISCDGQDCPWNTTITGKQDKYGHGGELFRAHLSLSIEEHFTLEPRR